MKSSYPMPSGTCDRENAKIVKICQYGNGDDGDDEKGIEDDK